MREFKKFLEEKDPDRRWGGLVGVRGEGGHVVWTREEVVRSVKVWEGGEDILEEEEEVEVEEEEYVGDDVEKLKELIDNLRTKLSAEREKTSSQAHEITNLKKMLADLKWVDELNALNLQGEKQAKGRRESKVKDEEQIKQMWMMK